MTLKRFLYYVAWSLCEGTIGAAGLSYHPSGKEHIYNASISGVEFATSCNLIMIVTFLLFSF